MGPSAMAGPASAAWEWPAWDRALDGLALDPAEQLFFFGEWEWDWGLGGAAAALLLAPGPAGECSSVVEAVFCLRLGEAKGVPGCEGGGGDGSGSGSASELIVKSVTAAAVSGLTGSEERSSRSGRGTLAEGTPAPAGVLAL